MISPAAATPKQQEFECLAYLLYSSPERTLYLDELLSDVPEISMIWRDCEHYLESIDSRFGPEPEPVNIDAIAEPISLPPTRRAEDPPEIQAKLREILTFFFQDNPNYPTPMPQAGFRLNGPSDVQRFELSRRLEPLARVSSKAHALKTWLELFFGLHMRSRGLFGTINQKVRTLESGLEAILSLDQSSLNSRAISPQTMFKKVHGRRLENLSTIFPVG